MRLQLLLLYSKLRAFRPGLLFVLIEFYSVRRAATGLAACLKYTWSKRPVAPCLFPVSPPPLWPRAAINRYILYCKVYNNMVI